MSKEYLRKVDCSDMELLYRWVNDPGTRANAFDSAPIPFDVHQKWFNDKLISPNVLFFIYHCDGKDVGQIRLEIKDDVAIIDYSIDVLLRGKGYAHKMMILIEKNIQKEHPEIRWLQAQVKHKNSASAKVFKKMNYTEYSKTDSIIKFIKALYSHPPPTLKQYKLKCGLCHRGLWHDHET